MIYNPNQPYNELPPLPPDKDVETKAVLKKANTATRNLAELKGLAESIPNQEVLLNPLFLLEAKASSEIENIVTTHEALFKAYTASLKQVDPATKEVLRYREALWDSYKLVQERAVIDEDVIIGIATRIVEGVEGIRDIEKIGNPTAIVGDYVVYTPPQGVIILQKKLQDLIEFINDADDYDPLVKMALIHYQFEAIHPFADGNGRTGRIINMLYLVLNGLLGLPILYLSKYIIENRGSYNQGLRHVTERGDWESWILYMLDAVEQTARYTLERIQDIRSRMNETLEIIKLRLPSRIPAKELVDVLFRQPYTKIQFLIDADIAARDTAGIYLQQLEEIGILHSEMVGREKLYLNLRLVDALRQ